MKHLDGLVEHVREAGLPVELRIEGDAAQLPPGVDVSAYSIVQEALTNTLKHAGPARARVVVRYAADELELEISDDGRAGGKGGSGRPFMPRLCSRRNWLLGALGASRRVGKRVQRVRG